MAYECTQAGCIRTFESKNQRTYHIRLEHQARTTATFRYGVKRDFDRQSDRTFHCTCGFKARDPKDLRSHARSHDVLFVNIRRLNETTGPVEPPYAAAILHSSPPPPGMSPDPSPHAGIEDEDADDEEALAQPAPQETPQQPPHEALREPPLENPPEQVPNSPPKGLPPPGTTSGAQAKGPSISIPESSHPLWKKPISDCWTFAGEEDLMRRMRGFITVDHPDDPDHFARIKELCSELPIYVNNIVSDMPNDFKRKLMTSIGCIAVDQLDFEWTEDARGLFKQYVLFQLRIFEPGFPLAESKIVTTHAAWQLQQYIAELAGKQPERFQRELCYQLSYFLHLSFFSRVASSAEYENSSLLTFIKLLAWNHGNIATLDRMDYLLDLMQGIIRSFTGYVANLDFRAAVKSSHLDDLKQATYQKQNYYQSWELLSVDLKHSFGALASTLNLVRNWQRGSFPIRRLAYQSDDNLIIGDRAIVRTAIGDLYRSHVSGLAEGLHLMAFTIGLPLSLEEIEDDICNCTAGYSFASKIPRDWLAKQVRESKEAVRVFDKDDKVLPEFRNNYYSFVDAAFRHIICALLLHAGDELTPDDVARLVCANGTHIGRSFYVVKGKMYIVTGREKIVQLADDLGLNLAKFLAFIVPFWEIITATTDVSTSLLRNSNPLDPPTLFVNTLLRPYPPDSISSIFRSEFKRYHDLDMTPELMGDFIMFMKAGCEGQTAQDVTKEGTMIGNLDLVSVSWETIKSLTLEKFEAVVPHLGWLFFIEHAVSLKTKDGRKRPKSEPDVIELASSPPAAPQQVMRSLPTSGDPVKPFTVDPVELIKALDITVVRQDGAFQRLVGDILNLNGGGIKVVIFAKTSTQVETLAKYDKTKIYSVDELALWKEDLHNNIIAVTFGEKSVLGLGIKLHIVHFMPCWEMEELCQHCLSADRFSVYSGRDSQQPTPLDEWSVLRWIESAQCKKVGIYSFLGLTGPTCTEDSAMGSCSSCRTSNLSGDPLKRLLGKLCRKSYCAHCLVHLNMTRKHSLEECAEFQANRAVDVLQQLKGHVKTWEHCCTCGLPADLFCSQVCGFGEEPMVLCATAMADVEFWRQLCAREDLPAGGTTDWAFAGDRLENGLSKLLYALYRHGFLPV
ncbi:hypothetical protein TWF173_010257 [Orbilia oligospora]|nr:hypothetical protein TWF173_010257 [Orbilia oligospora]